MWSGISAPHLHFFTLIGYNMLVYVLICGLRRDEKWMALLQAGSQ